MSIRPFTVQKLVSWAEKGICYGSLLLLAFIPIAEVVLRPFSVAIPASKSIMIHFFLVLGFFAAMLTAKSGEHITITTVQFIKSDRLKRVLKCMSAVVLVFILSVIAWNCVSYIKYGLMGRPVGPLTDQIFAIAMPLGYAVIALRFVFKLQLKLDRWLTLSAMLIGAFAALPAIAKIIWGVEPPEPFYSIVNFLYDAAWLIRVPAILFLIIAAFFGLPIFAAIGGIAMILLQVAGLEPEAAPIQIYSALTGSDIIAIPLFTLTGFFLSESRAGERLVRTFKAFMGWLPGGMVIATVVICAFFSSFTGDSGVTILALGGILYKILSDNKYPERFSIGLLTSAGSMGLLFPPSLPVILVASTSMTILHFMNVTSHYNIVHFFLGAIFPGIVLVVAMIIAGLVFSAKVKIPTEKFNVGEAMRSLRESFLEILLPVLLVAGYFSGRLTLVETSAVSVLYVLIVEVFIKKDIAIRAIPKVFSKAVPIIGGVLAILAMAKALSYAIVDSRLPENFTFWVQGAIQSKYVFLLLLNIALLVLGSVMDIFSAILVVFPLVVPLGHAYGIDPVHLGIIFIINLQVGFLTPPVGLQLFLASYRFEQPFGRVCRCVLPYIIIQFAIVLLVTYLPLLSTWLPRFFP
ncbi:MAG: TRAP transporter large permease subunit [Treponema sp.]|nr:TRAP transporter large permease subunit [Treponema sp.]